MEIIEKKNAFSRYKTGNNDFFKQHIGVLCIHMIHMICVSLPTFNFVVVMSYRNCSPQHNSDSFGHTTAVIRLQCDDRDIYSELRFNSSSVLSKQIRLLFKLKNKITWIKYLFITFMLIRLV